MNTVIKKFFSKQAPVLSQEDYSIMESTFEELLQLTKLSETDQFIQHGNTSTLLHSSAVMFYSYLFAKHFRIKVNKRSLIIGALLHDYCLYDWHIYDSSHRFHGFRHPYTALRNAKAHLQLNTIEENIIVRHMFPLVPIPPTCREAFIVSLIDKLCSIYETFSKNPYQRSFAKSVLLPKAQFEF